MCSAAISKKLTILINMVLAIILGTEVGVVLAFLGAPKFAQFGSVAAFSTVIEHYLTLNPIIFLKGVKIIRQRESHENTK